MVLITKEHEKGIWGFIGERRKGARGPISISHQLPTLDDDNGESADSWLQRKGEGSQKVDGGLATDSRGLWWAESGDKQLRLLSLHP